jgi:hypothetical protein
MGVLVQPVSNGIAIAAWHHLDAFYRRLFMRSAKLLGSVGLTVCVRNTVFSQIPMRPEG